jgi:hypothetical protein
MLPLPRITNPATLHRFQINFKTVEIIPSHYTLRHGFDNSDEVLRNWVLEASVDGTAFVELSTHTNDAKLVAAGGSTASWPIAARRGGAAYSYFRVRITGDNSPRFANRLMMAGFELYGVVRDC